MESNSGYRVSKAMNAREAIYTAWAPIGPDGPATNALAVDAVAEMYALGCVLDAETAKQICERHYETTATVRLEGQSQ